MSRTQRCGHCEGCLAKSCGTCVYCKDNPQNGGPGVKKQSCIARRCTKVLEGKLQREANGLRAKTGCGYCDECRQLDCGACLICLDKRFFRGRFLPNALCAKKKCSNARSLDVSPRHTPSPKYGFFKSKHELVSQLNNNNASCVANNNANEPFITRKRFMSDEMLLTQNSNGYAMMKRAKKVSDSGASSAHHLINNDQGQLPTYNQFSSAYPSTVNVNSNGYERASLMMPRQATTNQTCVNGTTPQAVAAYHTSPSLKAQLTGYNGSPPAGTVAPVPQTCPSSTEFNAYLHTTAVRQQGNTVAGQQASSPYHYHNHRNILNAASTSLSPTATADNLYDLYCSPSSIVGNRLTAASCSAPSSASFPPLQPPPYQWPSAKVSFPTAATGSLDQSAHNRHYASFDCAVMNANNNNNNSVANNRNNTVGEHHSMLRDRLSAALPPSNCHPPNRITTNNNNNNRNNNTSINSNNNNQLMQTTETEKHLKFVQSYNRPDKSNHFYNVNHHHHVHNQQQQQHHVMIHYQQQQSIMPSAIGCSIVTEQPMGPMDEQNVLLQQL